MSDYMNAKTENIQKFLDNCLKRQKDELIEEFLRDWKWGRVFKKHWNNKKLILACFCENEPNQYWKWFEKKWEERKK